jgi:2-alkenal reductase
MQDFNFHPFIPSPDSPDEPDEFLNRGQGSGFVWDNSGHIVTNYHVVENASEIEVIFANGVTAPAQILGGDPDADLAVIKVDLPASALPPVKLGDSDALQAGQLAIAIGNPFGQDFTMTNGIVSAIGRTIRSGNTPFSIPEVIQTDAPINPGNSGGPLLNRFGQVIGINTQIISRSGGSSGIGFAVPINIAKQVVPTLIKGQKYEYAWLGITGRTLTPDLTAAIDLPADIHGALVLAVAAGGPADKAGLKGSDKTAVEAGQQLPVGGDVITAINGQAVDSMDDLITYLMTETRPNENVTLAVTHANGAQETVTVTLAKRPSAEELSQEQ